MSDSGGSAGPTVAQAALRCVCPRCGQGKLFDGLLAFRPSCTVCGLDFSGMDTGDGFAVPPLWVHAIIWLPVTCGLALAMTRYIKSFLAAQQYSTRRSEMGG
jgi:uncharacterized protein (DUF983 family)